MRLKIAAFGNTRKSVPVTLGWGRADGYAEIGRIRRIEDGGYMFTPNEFGRETLKKTVLVGKTIKEIRVALGY